MFCRDGSEAFIIFIHDGVILIIIIIIIFDEKFKRNIYKCQTRVFSSSVKNRYTFKLQLSGSRGYRRLSYAVDLYPFSYNNGVLFQLYSFNQHECSDKLQLQSLFAINDYYL